MFAITVLVGSAGWTLLYKTKEPWETARIQLQSASGIIALDDEFGQHLETISSNISGWMSEDMDESKHAHVERALHQAKMQSLVQQRIEHDPALRMMRSPAVLQPHMMMPPAPSYNGR